MVTVQCICGFTGNVPDEAVGTELMCAQCGRKIMVSVAPRCGDSQVPENTSAQTHSMGSDPTVKQDRIKINLHKTGSEGDVSFPKELREARKRMWIGGFLVLVFGLAGLFALSVSGFLAFMAFVPTVVGIGFLLAGSYGKYVHDVDRRE